MLKEEDLKQEATNLIVAEAQVEVVIEEVQPNQQIEDQLQLIQIQLSAPSFILAKLLNSSY